MCCVVLRRTGIGYGTLRYATLRYAVDGARSAGESLPSVDRVAACEKKKENNTWYILRSVGYVPKVYRGYVRGKYYTYRTLAECSVRLQYATEHSGKVRYELDTGTRPFGMFGTDLNNGTRHFGKFGTPSQNRVSVYSLYMEHTLAENGPSCASLFDGVCVGPRYVMCDVHVNRREAAAHTSRQERHRVLRCFR